MLSIANMFLDPASRSTVCGDGCFIRSAFGQTLVRALNPDKSSSQDGHRWGVFNYNLEEMKPNGGSPRRGLGSSLRGPLGLPSGLSYEFKAMISEM